MTQLAPHASGRTSFAHATPGATGTTASLCGMIDHVPPRATRQRERLLRQGLRRTSMAQVAADAGITRAALYLHFSGREDVLRAVVARVYDGALADHDGLALTPRRTAAILEAAAHGAKTPQVTPAAYRRSLADAVRAIVG